MMNKEKYHIGRFAILLLLLIACTSFLYAQAAQPDQQVQNEGNAPKGQKLAFETDGVETATATTTDNGGAMGGIITVEQKLGADRLLFGFPKDELLYSKTIFIEDKAHGKSYTKAIDVDEQLLQRDGQAQRMGDSSTLILSAEPQGAAAVVLNTTNGNLIYNVITGTLVKESAITDHSKEGFSWADIIVIILYFAALLCIGVFFSKRQKNANDYFKGGERIPWWAAGLSLFGTALSAITFMAIPAKAFSTDWSYMLFNVGIVLVAPVIMFIFIPFFRKLDITTAYQYLEIRFNSLIRVICSLAFIIFQVGRMGVVLFLPAIAINIVTGFNIFLCIALMGVFSILYTRMGGIEAVVWTDALQVVILLGGAIFAIFHIVAQIPGGWSETMTIAIDCSKLNLGDCSFDFTNPTVWTVLIATCFTNLTMYGTDQSMVQRYLTTSSKKAAQKSVLTNALLTIPATIIFFFIGTVLFVFYKTYPTELSPAMENVDAVFPYYIYTKLPKGLIGLLISGIFAAAMSTLSGSMNSAATAFEVDIRPKLFPKSVMATGADDKRWELKRAKKTTMIIGVLSLLFAFLMATWDINSLWDEFNTILGLILGSMGGLFFLGMVTKRANAKGALIGMVVSIIVQALVARYTPVYLLLYTTVGFVTCFVVGYVASLFFPTKIS
ncbi:MAG: sodium:solute symporter [Bacteroidales bacterium]|nr:sodium:solute symporter [Bacteroidales bacterium]